MRDNATARPRDPLAMAIGMLAGLALFRWRIGVIPVTADAAAAGMAARSLRPLPGG